MGSAGAKAEGKAWIILSMAALAALICSTRALSAQVPRAKAALLESRVEAIFAQLTQEEKLGLLTGTGFTTQPVERLGLPPMGMADAGQGVRGGTPGTQGPATLFPAEIVMASSWDRDLLHSIGQAIGSELLNKGEGAQVLLGPDINIHRSPLGGRNGESFTEDPFLNGALAAAYIQGVQSTGAAACVKHFVCNNEEVDRNFVNVKVDQRTLHEIYLAGFKAAVQTGGAWTVMSAYNKINGPYATANYPLQVEILKRQWGFDGLVMSDWGAVHETAGAINGGCDLEMPGGEFLTRDRLRAALMDGTIKQTAIDDSVRRILRTVVRVGLLDHPAPPDHSVVNSVQHQQLAYRAAAEGMVLLKNAGSLLPLNRVRIKTIAIIGPGAAQIQAGAEGSPAVQPFYQIQPLEGIRRSAGSGVNVRYVEGVSLPNSMPDTIPTGAVSSGDGGTEHGFRGEYFTSADLSGAAAISRIDPEIRFFSGRRPRDPGEPLIQSARWTGSVTPPQSGDYTFTVVSGSGVRLLIDDHPLIDSPKPEVGHFLRSGKISLIKGKPYKLRLELLQVPGRVRARMGWTLPQVNHIPLAVEAAAHSDVAIIIASTRGTDGEGRDRPSMDLPRDQDRLIEAISRVNRNCIVVLNSGTPCTVTHWLPRVRSLLFAGFPGEEAGHALGSILFGEVNPSGKLTDTFGAKREDYPDYGNFPGTNGAVNYAEGVFVGYRHFDHKGLTPVFPFGYGLSYTHFRYTDLVCSSKELKSNGTISIHARVTNTGGRTGDEIIQLYVRDPHPTLDRPIRELKGFARVHALPHQSRTVTFELGPEAFAYYDAAARVWRAHPGEYIVEIGASSRDIRLSRAVRLTDEFVRQD